MNRYLVILEVSQKQAYIFGSNKVKDNIVNSAIIAYVLGEKYIDKVLSKRGYDKEKNMVYSGGGHTILEFPDIEIGKSMIKELTEQIYRNFDGLEVFAAIEQYKEESSVGENLKALVKKLERKKSLRKPAFRQGSYGIEQVDLNTLKPKCVDYDSEEKLKVKELENKEAKSFYPEKYKPAYEFEKLGGKKNDSNFIAVVHIDGNGMGKRVGALYDELKNVSWEEAKKILHDFSECIDNDFKDAYREMTDEVAEKLLDKEISKELELTEDYFPVRHIITAGDDICFVTEGRIGIECARIFIEKLSDKTNKVDNKGYSACAGVCIVHCKYPFFRAYELAEMLCSNAKAYGAEISPGDNGRSISSVDWHIEFGELQDSLTEVRKEYAVGDGTELELRPYVIKVSNKEVWNKINQDKNFQYKKYDNFKNTIGSIQKCEKDYGIGKVKGLRTALKQGEISVKNYMHFYKMNNFIDDYTSRDFNLDTDKLFTGTKIEIPAYVKLQNDEKKRSVIFDAIELMDTYISL